ncbi:hypothetical protein HDV00_007830 [Rhizophlyctis rosea]|nr:hypothetical protein HDV00_007830 [Rhizophlyctis rosea]
MTDAFLDAYLACAACDGSVAVWRISANLNDISKLDVMKAHEVAIADGRLPTVMKFRPQFNSPPVLIVAKSRRILLWYSPPVESESQREGEVVFNDVPVGIPIGGIVSGVNPDELRVYTIDGNCHILSTELREGQRCILLSEDATPFLREEILQKEPVAPAPTATTGIKVEEVESQEETSIPTSKQLRIWGAAASGNGLYDALVYTLASTSDMVYQTTKHQVAMLTIRSSVTQGDEDLEESLMDRIKGVVARSDCLIRWTSSYLLWDIVAYCESEAFQWADPEISFFRRLLDVLNELRTKAADAPPDANNALFSLSKSLYQSNFCNILRFHHFIVSSLKRTMSSSIKSELGATITENMQLLFTYYVGCAIRAISAHAQHGVMKVSDLDFRMILLLSDCVVIRKDTMSNLLPLVRGLFTILSEKQDRHAEAFIVEDARAYLAVIGGSTSKKISDLRLPPREQCPACNEPVPFDSIMQASCPRKHVFGK